MFAPEYRSRTEPFPSEPYRNYACFGCGWDPQQDSLMLARIAQAGQSD